MAYCVKLSQFEGPLDLLLHLIEDAELDSKDIFVSEITAQYLACMEGITELELDAASEFLAMAATLLYIKSRQLLPRPPREEPEEEDPEEALLRQLREYKAFKEASAGLSRLMDRAGGAMARLPEDVPLPPRNIELDGATLDGLYQSFLALLSRTEVTELEEQKRALHHVRQDAFTVRRQIGRIRAVLGKKENLLFTELFTESVSRMEMIVTFMALLEMIAGGEIVLRQKEPFAPIRISAGALREGDDEGYQYMDETDETL